MAYVKRPEPLFIHFPFLVIRTSYNQLILVHACPTFLEILRHPEMTNSKECVHLTGLNEVYSINATVPGIQTQIKHIQKKKQIDLQSFISGNLLTQMHPCGAWNLGEAPVLPRPPKSAGSSCFHNLATGAETKLWSKRFPQTPGEVYNTKKEKARNSTSTPSRTKKPWTWTYKNHHQTSNQ